MTNKQIKSEVKRLNQRLTQISKDFGLDSQTYKDAIAQLSSDKFKDITHTTSKGVLQLDSNNQAISSPEFEHALAILRKKAVTLTSRRINATESKEDIVNRVENSKQLSRMISDQIAYIYETMLDSEIEKNFPFLFEKRDLTDEEIMEILAYRVEDEDIEAFQ